MNEKLKDRDVLLVKEKGSNDLKVANTGKEGETTSRQSQPEANKVEPSSTANNTSDANRIDWSQIEKTGITREMLE